MTTNLQTNSTLVTEALCDYAYSFKQQKLIVLNVFAQTLIYILTFLFIYLILFKSKGVRRIWSLIERDLKIITAIGLLFYFAATVSAFLVTAYKLVLLLFNFSKCDYVWKGSTCYFAQILQSGICVTSYSLFHFMILAERSYVSVINSHHKLSGLMGVISGLLLMILSPLPQLSVLRDQDFYEPRAYCFHFFSSAETSGRKPAFVLIFFDLAVTFGDVCLFYYNKRQIKKQRSSSHGFNLHRSFFLRQMEISVKIIYPYSILHSVTYIIQASTYVYFIEKAVEWPFESLSLLYENLSLIRSISNLLLFAFIWLYSKKFENHGIDRRIHTSNEADLFFNEFQRIIS